MNTQQEIKLTYITAPTDRNVVILKRDGKVFGTAKLIPMQGTAADSDPVMFWQAQFDVGPKKITLGEFTLPEMLMKVRAVVEAEAAPTVGERAKITAERLLEAAGLKMGRGKA